MCQRSKSVCFSFSGHWMNKEKTLVILITCLPGNYGVHMITVKKNKLNQKNLIVQSACPGQLDQTIPDHLSTKFF